MLRKIRVVVASVMLALVTLYFMDFAGLLPDRIFGWLEKIQFVPALLSMSFVIVAVLLIMTLIFGRIYCSVICPLGIFQDFVAWLSRHTGKKNAKRQNRYGYSPARTLLRWIVFAVAVATLVAGVTFIPALVEPYSSYGRIVSQLFKPIYELANNLLAAVTTAAGSYAFYKVSIYVTSWFVFSVAAITFVVIVFLAWRGGRTYCNTICPVGTLLGLLSRWSLLKVRIDTEKCNGCTLCSKRCKASCIDAKRHEIDYSRCVVCFDCIDNCRQGAISYVLRTKKAVSIPKAPIKNEIVEPDKAVSSPENDILDKDVSRRQFLTAGLALVAVAKAGAQENLTNVTAMATGTKPINREKPIMPPGAGDLRHFSQHCTSCHLCVSRCPSHVLKPSLLEYGFGGMMQPRMDFEHGYCNFDCTLCGEVCPNGAIQPLSVEQKHLTQMGHVVFILENCIVYRNETSCGACSEHCPTQALSMIPYKDSLLTIPSVDTTLCVGCGGCEHICPAEPFKAVYIEGNSPQTQSRGVEKGDEQRVELDGFGF